MKTSGQISHDRSEESPEAKTRWFRTLPLEERMRTLCEWTDLALALNPALQEKKIAQPASGRVQVLRAP